jgi:hypothetical protein
MVDVEIVLEILIRSPVQDLYDDLFQKGVFIALRNYNKAKENVLHGQELDPFVKIFERFEKKAKECDCYNDSLYPLIFCSDNLYRNDAMLLCCSKLPDVETFERILQERKERGWPMDSKVYRSKMEVYGRAGKVDLVFQAKKEMEAAGLNLIDVCMNVDINSRYSLIITR